MPFQKGNQLGKNTSAGAHHRALELRDDLINRVKQSKKEINEALIKLAKKGNVPAIKEIYDRTIGKTTEYVDITSGGEPIIYIDPIIATKNGITPSTENHSG